MASHTFTILHQTSVTFTEPPPYVNSANTVAVISLSMTPLTRLIRPCAPLSIASLPQALSRPPSTTHTSTLGRSRSTCRGRAQRKDTQRQTGSKSVEGESGARSERTPSDRTDGIAPTSRHPRPRQTGSAVVRVPSGSPSALPPRCATPIRELETPTAHSHSHAIEPYVACRFH